MNRNKAIIIIQIVFTVIYGLLCKIPWAGNETCRLFFFCILINLSLTFTVNLIFFAVIKLEMYELLAGYDKSKAYDKDILKDHVKRLAFYVSLMAFIVSVIPVCAPLLSAINISGDFWITAYMFLVIICMLGAIIITDSWNKKQINKN
ncbi:MAG: hypothetical protein K2N72_07995 [Oscillospiraceae bacterium]|nr:hypothetical protein [Oscillospiraceae bacterium]